MFAYVTHDLAFCRYNSWGRLVNMLRLVRLGKLYQIISDQSCTKHILARLDDLVKEVSGIMTINSSFALLVKS